MSNQQANAAREYALRTPEQRAPGQHGVTQSSTGGTGASREFAERVKTAATKTSVHGRFGDDKVFISHAHREYTKAHGSIPLHEFKSKLMEAHIAGHLRLSRANMVEAMNPTSVGMSRTLHPGSHDAEFHFVNTPAGGDSIAPKRTRTVQESLERVQAKKERSLSGTSPEKRKRAVMRASQAQAVARDVQAGKHGMFTRIKLGRMSRKPT